MEILFSFFEGFSLTSEPMLLLLPFLLLGYRFFSSFGYKELFLIVIGLLFFWAISQFSILAVGLILIISFINFFLIRLYQQTQIRSLRYGAFVFNFSVLIALKYISESTLYLNSLSSFVGFVGISFYVFHVWSIYDDIYRDKILRRVELLTFLVYLLYFPKIITGPLVRYNDFEKELQKDREDENFLLEGIGLFIYGMMIKALANYIGTYPLNIYGNLEGYSGFEHLIAMYGYALYIFLDFSAYTNIARGISRVFGIELPINFLSPYRSTSMIDFWRRWHMSLSFWIRDYIYIPLGGSKNGSLSTYKNLFIAFFLSGVWHGVGLNYALWGIIHGVGIIINKYFGKFTIRLPQFFGWFITFHWVAFGWIFFANSIDGALYSIEQILFGFEYDKIFLVISNNLSWFGIAFVTFFFSLWENFVMERFVLFFMWLNIAFKVVVFTLILYIVIIASQNGAQTFIYQSF